VSLADIAQRFREWNDPNLKYRRVVAGTPQGGQFAPGYHSEVAIVLTPQQEDFNAEGSWHNPAYPQTAAQALDFWGAVPVPDFITEHIFESYPKVGHPGTARMLARCSRLLTETPLRLSTDELAKVLFHPFQFPDGQVFTATDALAWYGVERAHQRGRLIPAEPTD